MAPASSTEMLRETLALFETSEEPRTTTEVADALELGRRIDGVEAAYPTAEMLRRRQISRDRDGSRRLQRQLADGFTDRQRTALGTAYNAGVFEWPRDASVEDIAASISVAPSKFHQHLRRAERWSRPQSAPDPLVARRGVHSCSRLGAVQPQERERRQQD